MLINLIFKYNDNPAINYHSTPNPASTLDGLVETLISNYDAINSGVDLQCKLLQDCIRDVERNSKKYHISFMIEKINTGTYSGRNYAYKWN
jgi:hypothetical protein